MRIFKTKQKCIYRISPKGGVGCWLQVCGRRNEKPTFKRQPASSPAVPLRSHPDEAACRQSPDLDSFHAGSPGSLHEWHPPGWVGLATALKLSTAAGLDLHCVFFGEQVQREVM